MSTIDSVVILAVIEAVQLIVLALIYIVNRASARADDHEPSNDGT